MVTSLGSCRRDWERSPEPWPWNRTGGLGARFPWKGRGNLGMSCKVKAAFNGAQGSVGTQERCEESEDNFPSFVFEILENVY